MSRLTQALVAVTKGKLELKDIYLESLHPHEVLVEIRAVGICHADISCLKGVLPVPFPIVLGHEGAGTVIEVGEGVDGDIAPGDKVLLSYNSCSQCVSCKAGSPAYCQKMFPLNFGGTRTDGLTPMRLECEHGTPLHGSFFGQSSFSRLAIVSHRCLVKITSVAPLDLLAPLGCGLQTGAGVIFNTLDVAAGTSVVVFGTGAVGMAAIMAAKIRGANPIIGIDIIADRLPIALELGATHALCCDLQQVVPQVKDLCGGNGAANAIDTTGNASVIATMMDCLEILGTGVSIGAPSPGTKAQIDIISHITMGKKYIGCNQGSAVPQEMIPFLIEEHYQGRFPFEKIVKLYEVKDFAKALEDMSSGRTIKPVLVWPE